MNISISAWISRYLDACRYLCVFIDIYYIPKGQVARCRGQGALSMVSSKDSKRPRREQGTCRTAAPITESMVSSKGAGGAIEGFIEGRKGGREQRTPHAQRDMCGISPAICRLEGVASICFFPNKFFLNWSIEMKGRVALTQSSYATGKTKKKTRSANQIQKQRDKGYKRIDKFNSNKA